jgi:hypothetical protein
MGQQRPQEKVEMPVKTCDFIMRLLSARVPDPQLIASAWKAPEQNILWKY